LIAIRCTTPSVPVDPIAMNTVPIPPQCLGKVARVVQAGGTDAQPAGFAEGAAGLAGVAYERGDRIAARAGRGRSRCRRGRWRRSLRCSSCLLPVPCRPSRGPSLRVSSR
jgi:hypothetical protein